MELRTLAFASFVALTAPACAVQSVDPTDDPGEDTGVTASAATATRVYASEGDLDLSFETLGTFEDRDGGRALILHATANRYLESVFTFVPDDAFGEAHIISERRLEVVLHEGHELNTVLSGLPLFVAVNTFTGSPNHYTAKIEVAPRFYDFRGSNAIWIDEAVTPLYKVNGVDNLVYRGNAGALASQLTVTAPDGAPTVARVDADSFHLDWSYTAVYQAIDPHTVPLTFTADLTAGGTAQKTSRLVARVTSLALTSGDAYDVWPSSSCQSAVYSCIHAQPVGATDFTACGTYREVSRCMYANACEVTPPAPLSLTPLDNSALEPARETWNVGSDNGAWHELTVLDPYSTPACPAAPVTIQGVMAQINATMQAFPDAGDGSYTDRAGLAQNVLFNDNYYGDGAALLAAIDGYAGGGAIQAWISSQPLSCNNCHDFGEWVVLYYPASGKVVVLQGHHGYDS
jgi:hypothetical protein